MKYGKSIPLKLLPVMMLEQLQVIQEGSSVTRIISRRKWG
jgi:hypothetical protein